MKKSLRRIGVSDHALVRYLERVHGLNISEIRREIANEDLRRQVSGRDSNTGIFTCVYNVPPIASHPNNNKYCQVVMECGTIITIQIKDNQKNDIKTPETT